MQITINWQNPKPNEDAESPDYATKAILLLLIKRSVKSIKGLRQVCNDHIRCVLGGEDEQERKALSGNTRALLPPRAFLIFAVK